MSMKDSRQNDLQVNIGWLRQDIEDRESLLEVLERDGHNVSDQEAVLQKDRSQLAVMISRHLALLI